MIGLLEFRWKSNLQELIWSIDAGNPFSIDYAIHHAAKLPWLQESFFTVQLANNWVKHHTKWNFLANRGTFRNTLNETREVYILIRYIVHIFIIEDASPLRELELIILFVLLYVLSQLK